MRYACPQRQVHPKAPLMKPLVLLVTAAILLCTSELHAQKVHFAVISLDSRTTVSGFLHSVTDSAVIIVPGYRKKHVAMIDKVQPLAVPIKAIEHMVTWRVHGYGTVLMQLAVASAVSTTTTFIALDKIGPRWGLPTSFVSNMALILGYARFANTQLSPRDHFFREKVEDKCIHKDDRSIVAFNLQTAAR